MIYLLLPCILIPLSCYTIYYVWVTYHNDKYLAKLKRKADAQLKDDTHRNFLLNIQHQTNTQK